MFCCFQVCNLGGIQKLCDALQENPSMTVAHLAALFALQDTFQHPIVLRYAAGYEITRRHLF
jgi:hypothetical protein